jgi:undecaprenyl-diphosphatase
MDDAVTQWINASAGSSAMLDTFMVALTQYGVPLLVLLVNRRGVPTSIGMPNY